MWWKPVAKKSATQLAIEALGMADISLEDRNLLTGAILDTLQAAPLRAILETDEVTGEMLIGGRTLTIEKGKQLQEAATQMLRNPALNLIREQVTYTAFVLGGIKAEKPYDMVFARAALWWCQECERLLKLLAQQNHTPEE